MEIKDEIRKALDGALADRFPAEIIENISLDSVEVNHDLGEIRIVLKVTTSVDPDMFARGYFGLTSKFGRMLADSDYSLTNLFPVITPVMGSRVNA